MSEGFSAGPDDLEAITDICRRLDGIPLAIEFAAARVSHLSPKQIRDRLGDALRLLGGGRRRPERQQTLEATLDWSHGLLTETERAVFRRLAVFPGSFDVTAAEGIATDAEVASEQILDLLASLVAKSLLGTQEDRRGLRYRLLETVRAYALRKLDAAGETDGSRCDRR